MAPVATVDLVSCPYQSAARISCPYQSVDLISCPYCGAAAVVIVDLISFVQRRSEGRCGAAQVTTDNLERVRKVKTRHQRLLARTTTVREELERFLEDDDDMAKMCLTRRAEVPLFLNKQDMLCIVLCATSHTRVVVAMIVVMGKSTGARDLKEIVLVTVRDRVQL